MLLSNAGGKMVQWGKMFETKPIARTHMVERDSLTKYPLTVTCTHSKQMQYLKRCQCKKVTLKDKYSNSPQVLKPKGVTPYLA